MTTRTRYESRSREAPEPVAREEPVVWGGADDGPLGPAALASYERDGYLTVNVLLDAGEVAELRKETERLAIELSARADERAIIEPGSGEVRSIFEVHASSERFRRLTEDPRLVGPARQFLGSDVYVHQSRVNRKPGFRGKEFYWHSDFETWHHEDGMPQMRAVSVSIALTPNSHCNGSLMVIPRSHRTFVGCAGATPDDHYRQSLRRQEYGVPSDEALARLVDEGGIATITGDAGSAVFFDCNAMHGSNGNITPHARCNVFVVFNSTENRLDDPLGGTAPRPRFIAHR